MSRITPCATDLESRQPALARGSARTASSTRHAAGIQVPLELVRRHLGLPADCEWTHDLVARVARARTWYGDHGRPWSARRELDISACIGDRIVLEGGSTLTSSVLAAGLEEAGAHALCIVAISAGPEVDHEIDRLWKNGHPDRAMFLHAHAIAVAERLRSTVSSDLTVLAGRDGMTVLPHYSPGYDGWDLADQRTLHTLLVEADLELPGPLDLLPSGSLNPAKSMLAAYGITRTSRRGLASTGRRGDLECFWTRRRVEGIDDVEADEPAHPLPAYSVPVRTLERWATRRLTVTDGENGRSLRARFRFDGTTCSSLGMPLAFDYEVELAREAGPRAYRVRSCRCSPAYGDTGHRGMCGYLAAPEQFMRAVRETPDWVGRTLDELLGWTPATSLTGCLCTRASRDHKWRLVVQTLHYASRNGFATIRKTGSTEGGTIA